MLFKKEFDIDKDFFTEESSAPEKRKIALRVFLFVGILTFLLLFISAFGFGLNSGFGSGIENVKKIGLKEAQEFFFDALKSYETGEYDSAIEKLNKQLAIVDDPDAYNYLAKIYLEKGDNELAIENFKKAIEFKPDFFEANFELGKIYFSNNDFKNAVKYLKAASEVQVDNTELLNLTAQTCKMTGRADEAISLFENILEKEPENGFANAKIAEIYFQRLQYEKAIPYYKEALFFTFDENTAIQLAKCYLETGDFDNAESVANEILKVNPENKQAKSLKISLEYKRGLVPSTVKKNTEETPIEKEEPPLDENIVKNYITEFENSIKANWTPPSGSNLKKVSVKFTVDKDGKLVSNTVYQSSGMSDFDKSALDAIELSAPFPPLPYGMNRETLDIIFTFDFNIKN